jgi:hypothetical protein
MLSALLSVSRSAIFHDRRVRLVSTHGRCAGYVTVALLPVAVGGRPS